MEGGGKKKEGQYQDRRSGGLNLLPKHQRANKKMKDEE